MLFGFWILFKMKFPILGAIHRDHKSISRIQTISYSITVEWITKISKWEPTFDAISGRERKTFMLE